MRSLAFLAALAGCGDNLPSEDASVSPDRVLVFTRTLGHRHGDEIAAGLRAVQPRLDARNIVSDLTEDPAAFTDENLARYRAVVFFYTTGNDLLDPAGKAAFEAYVRQGGGFLGVHSATDAETEWPFYAELIVTHYAGHPVLQPATLHVEGDHPTTRALPDPWMIEYDEWYNFSSNPRDVPGVKVLVTIDESTYTGGTMGVDHPMVWCHENLGGRAYYSQLFHAYWRWEEPIYVDFIEAAVLWVMRRAQAPR